MAENFSQGFQNTGFNHLYLETYAPMFLIWRHIEVQHYEAKSQETMPSTFPSLLEELFLYSAGFLYRVRQASTQVLRMLPHKPQYSIIFQTID